MTTHRFDISGKPDASIFADARRLLREGASPEDRVEHWRGDMLCVSGNVGKLAGLRLIERKTGTATFVWEKYRPHRFAQERSSSALPMRETPYPATALPPHQTGAPQGPVP